MADQGNRSRYESTSSEREDLERFFVLPSEAAERIRNAEDLRSESRRSADGGEHDPA